MDTLLFVALLVFFVITALKDFGIVFKYNDLLRGLAAVLIIIAMVVRGL